MLQLCSLLIFITLWFSLELVCKASITAQKDTFFPLPSNLKIHLYPGIINVTWDCNITNSMKKHTYHIEFQKELSKKIEISKCLYEYFVTDDMEIQIHKGLEINISSDSEWKNEYFIPEGKNNTAAENFHCDVYVSIINCSWTVGLEAPEDTQYTLAFRKTQKSQISNPKQNRIYVPCDGYRTDSFNRQIGCTLKSPKMYFNKYVYLQLVGSSNESSIQFFDTILPLHEIVILDPPRNIRWNYNSTELKITWDPPETYSNQDSHSFTYGVNINGAAISMLFGGYSNISSLMTEYNVCGLEHEVTINRQSYQLSNLNKKVNVSLRVKWNKTWSRWSEPLIIEPDLGPDSSNLAQNHIAIILGIVTFAILFLLIFLCHRFQVWKRLFPRIPKPAEKIFEKIERNEFMEHNIRKKSLPQEDFICFQVTEVPLKEEPQNQK